jgi:protein SCO1/2
MSMNKSSITMIALAALAIGFGVSWYLASSRPIQLESGTWFGEQARALADFELTDHRNLPLTRAELTGKWSLMFFGFTHCPDICPVTLQTLDRMLGSIDDADVSAALQVYFVSVDPYRDTPERLAEYVAYFNPAFIGASAPPQKLRQLTGPLGIAHQIHQRSGDSENYGVDHSGAVVLINPQAEFAGLFGAPQDAAAMARDLTRIVEHH